MPHHNPAISGGLQVLTAFFSSIRTTQALAPATASTAPSPSSNRQSSAEENAHPVPCVDRAFTFVPSNQISSPSAVQRKSSGGSRCPPVPTTSRPPPPPPPHPAAPPPNSFRPGAARPSNSPASERFGVTHPTTG